MYRLPLFLVSVLYCAQLHAQAQFLLQPQSDNNAAPAALLGAWGTTSQCAAHRAGNSDDPRLFPYEISRDWIKQGMIYCYLQWLDHYQIDDGSESLAVAQCGEDNVVDYRVVLQLNSDRLRIRWSSDFTTRALESC